MMDDFDWMNAWREIKESGGGDGAEGTVSTEPQQVDSTIGDDSTAVSTAGDATMSTTEALAMILRCLRTSEDRSPLSLSAIQQRANIPHNVMNDPTLIRSLQTNEKILYNFATGMYSYRPLYACSDIHDILRLLRQQPNGIKMSDLHDSYARAEQDLEHITRSGGLTTMAEAAGLNRGPGSRVAAASLSASEGGLVRLRNKDRALGDVCLWRAPLMPEVSADYRMAEFVKLSGTLTVKHGHNVATTTADLTLELFRNDAVIILGKVFRVSSKSLSAATQRKLKAEERRKAREELEAYMLKLAGSLPDSSNVTDGEPEEPPAKRPRKADGATAALSKKEKAAPEKDEEAEDTSSSESEVDLLDAELDFDPDGNSGKSEKGGKANSEAVADDHEHEHEEVYPPNGIYVVSVANDVKRTGGAFSVADTAPHRLPTGSAGYAQPFTPIELPLDRPWDGPDATGVVAYKIGCTGDIRTIWRLVGDAKKRKASDIAAASAMNIDVDSEGAAGATIAHAEGILPKLGGSSALELLSQFPISHIDLQRRMYENGISITKAEPSEGGESRPMTRAERAAARRMNRVRKPHAKSLLISVKGLEGTDVAKEAQKHAILNQLKKYNEQKKQAEARMAEQIRRSATEVYRFGGSGR